MATSYRKRNGVWYATVAGDERSTGCRDRRVVCSGLVRSYVTVGTSRHQQLRGL